MNVMGELINGDAFMFAMTVVLGYLAGYFVCLVKVSRAEKTPGRVASIVESLESFPGQWKFTLEFSKGGGYSYPTATCYGSGVAYVVNEGRGLIEATNGETYKREDYRALTTAFAKARGRKEAAALNEAVMSEPE